MVHEETGWSRALVGHVARLHGEPWGSVKRRSGVTTSRGWGPLQGSARGSTHDRVDDLSARAAERDGLVSRTVRPTVRPCAEYAPTGRGRDLHAILYRVVDWTGENLTAIEVPRAAYGAGHPAGAGP
ncbi:winged helix-turn-helix transcriptional regulator [Streptomyces sp. NPDC050509]|uniref:winged helix-turn-helix transcriptional regulator n=1 Tax=Streptomyces sp. NPDC050509 TaxID=3365620 RepID=UPI00378F5544